MKCRPGDVAWVKRPSRLLGAGVVQYCYCYVGRVIHCQRLAVDFEGVFWLLDHKWPACPHFAAGDGPRVALVDRIQDDLLEPFRPLPPQALEQTRLDLETDRARDDLTRLALPEDVPC